MTNTLTSETKNQIQAFLRDTVARDGVPGLAVSIVDRNQTIFAQGIGARDQATNTPATPETLFGIGSTTKSFTALAIMQLADEGSLSLSDSVINYLPVSFDSDVTIHHLLSHTSGAASNGMAGVLLSRLTGVGNPGIPMSDREDFLMHVNEAIEDGTFEPGSRFYYYASGFTLLGMLIEEVTGQSYREIMADRVLNPLGMTRSTFSREVFEADPNRMTPYAPTEDGFDPAPFPFHDLIDATGGLLAPVDELAAYVRLYLNQGSHEGSELVTTSGIEAMQNIHADTDGEMGVEGYGYALMIDDIQGEQLVGHSGDAVTSSGYIGFLPDAGYGVAIGCNTSPPFKLNLLGKAILGAVLGQNPNKVVPYFELRELFTDLAGTYESHRGTKHVKVIAEGARLKLDVKGIVGSQQVPLTPISLEGDTMTFAANQTSATPMNVEFSERNGRMELRMERYQLRRKTRI